jgi:hypothetical protein
VLTMLHRVKCDRRRSFATERILVVGITAGASSMVSRADICLRTAMTLSTERRRLDFSKQIRGKKSVLTVATWCSCFVRITWLEWQSGGESTLLLLHRNNPGPTNHAKRLSKQLQFFSVLDGADEG